MLAAKPCFADLCAPDHKGQETLDISAHGACQLLLNRAYSFVWWSSPRDCKLMHLVSAGAATIPSIWEPISPRCGQNKHFPTRLMLADLQGFCRAS